MKRIRYVAFSEDLPERFLDADLSPEALGVHLAAYAVSSRGMLDGRLSRPRLRRVFGWSEAVEQKLVDAGIWLPLHDGGVELAGYLDDNRSREEIEHRAKVASHAASVKWENKRAGEPTSRPVPSLPVPIAPSALHDAMRHAAAENPPERRDLEDYDAAVAALQVKRLSRTEGGAA